MIRRIGHIAWREFVATVATKGFLFGLLIMPAIMALMVMVGPRLFNPRNFQVQGQVAIVDPTGVVAPGLRDAVNPDTIRRQRAARARAAMENAPESVRNLAESAEVMAGNEAMEQALGTIPEVEVIQRPPDSDVEAEKAWLLEDHDGPRRLALAVVHADAIEPAPGSARYGTYDLYVSAAVSEQANDLIRDSMREAIVSARVEAQQVDRAALDALMTVGRVRSITVTEGEERATVGGLNIMLPIAFGILLMMGVMTGGQQLLTATVEEKSSRVVEVLLSAVSPIELMAGKILGDMAVSFVVLGLYIVLGMGLLFSFALFGLLDLWLLFYLMVFFIITYLVFGGFMVAVGAAVNEMREAQSLMAPIMIAMMVPWMLWFPISQNPNSTFATVVSFVPPVNTFAMLLRMTSATPPPLWQVWLTIVVGVASVFASIWFAAKVFRIGLLMYGKPPNFATLIRWARSA